MGFELLEVQPPVVAVDNERVADIKRDTDLQRVGATDDLAEFGKIAAKVSVAGRRMVLDECANAELLVQCGEVFEAGFDFAYLAGDISFAFHETETVKLDAEVLSGAQNVFGMWRRDAGDGGGEQRQLQVVLAQRVEVSGQIFGG